MFVILLLPYFRPLVRNNITYCMMKFMDKNPLCHSYIKLVAVQMASNEPKISFMLMSTFVSAFAADS